MLSGDRLREPQRRLDGLGATAVELDSVERLGEQTAQHPDHVPPRRRSERADRRGGDLGGECGHQSRIGVADRVHAAGALEVHDLVPIEVTEHGALGGLHAQLGPQHDGLQTRTDRVLFIVPVRIREFPRKVAPPPSLIICLLRQLLHPLETRVRCSETRVRVLRRGFATPARVS